MTGTGPRAVLFDLGNTLVTYYQRGEFPDVLRRCLRGATEATGQSMSAEELEAVFPRAVEFNREAADFAVRPLHERLRELIPDCRDSSDAEMEPICRAFMSPIFACAQPDPGATAVLDSLRARGVRTAIVSNTPWGSPGELWRAELDRFGLLARTDAAVFCVDVGWRKPHPAPILHALARLGVAARDAIFVGDDARWDVEGARRAGVRPVLFAPEAEATNVDCVVVRRLDAVLDLVEGGQSESRLAV